MRRGAPRRLVALTVALGCGAALGVATPRDAAASTCGDDASPACPVVTGVAPNVVPTPVRNAVVTITGRSLGGVASAILQPGGYSLRIVGHGDTEIDVRLPNGLGDGAYSIALPLAGQDTNVVSTNLFHVGGDAGGGGLPAFSFAPATTATPRPAVKAATPGPVAAGVVATSTTSGRFPLTVVVAAVAVGALCVVALVVRRRREAYLRELGYDGMDRRLDELWADLSRAAGATTPALDGAIAPSRPNRR